jgi:hypothetical protein
MSAGPGGWPVKESNIAEPPGSCTAIPPTANRQTPSRRTGSPQAGRSPGRRRCRRGQGGALKPACPRGRAAETGGYPAAAASHQLALALFGDSSNLLGHAEALNRLGELSLRTSPTEQARGTAAIPGTGRGRCRQRRAAGEQAARDAARGTRPQQPGDAGRHLSGRGCRTYERFSARVTSSHGISRSPRSRRPVITRAARNSAVVYALSGRCILANVMPRPSRSNRSS